MGELVFRSAMDFLKALALFLPQDSRRLWLGGPWRVLLEGDLRSSSELAISVMSTLGRLFFFAGGGDSDSSWAAAGGGGAAGAAGAGAGGVGAGDLSFFSRFSFFLLFFADSVISAAACCCSVSSGESVEEAEGAEGAEGEEGDEYMEDTDGRLRFLILFRYLRASEGRERGAQHKGTVSWGRCARASGARSTKEASAVGGGGGGARP
jgi:hypothetical protein